MISSLITGFFLGFGFAIGLIAAMLMADKVETTIKGKEKKYLPYGY